MRRRSDQTGAALVVVLILLAIGSLWGVTVLETSSTETAMAGHYRRALVAFYAAEAGSEEARARLRGPGPGNPLYLGDRQLRETPRWSAYLSAVSTWSPGDDEHYSSASTNYFPTRANPANTRIVTNSAQTRLQYWVKIQHKTEYDAERAGHRVTTPHYLDRDGRTRRHRGRNTSRVIYYGFPPGYAGAPVQFTTDRHTPFAPVERLTAYGLAGTARSVIEMEVVHPAPLPHLAALYARRGIRFSTPSAVVSGRDQCGRVAAIPALYTAAPSTTIGTARLSGATSVSETGPVVLELERAVAALREEARPLASSYREGQPLGDAAHPVVVHAATASVVQRLSGDGILVASEDISLVGPLVWRGPILSRGQVRIDATRGGVTVEGIVWADSIVITGRATVVYDSCRVKSVFMSLPLQVISWRERV